ncbi:MAG: hydantoinase/oxoprolinase family protein [Thermoleophilia bacterium]
MGVDIGINVGTSAVTGVFSGPTGSAAARALSFKGELTPALSACLEDGAERLGFASARAMLRVAQSVVMSVPAAGPRAIAQGSGPNMGLLVTRGLEEDIFSRLDSGAHAAVATIRAEMIESVDEEIDSTGAVIREPLEEDVREAVRRLLQLGAEALVVGLRRSPLNPTNETKIREMIEHEYPAHYLGAVPVVLSVDHGATLDDGARTASALLNAYCTAGTARLLYEAEDLLRDGGFVGVMRVLDAAGGTCRVCKCVPSRCIDSDLAAHGSVAAELAARHGLKDVVVLDMGARGTRLGILKDGEAAPSAASGRPRRSAAYPVPVFRHIRVGSHSVLAAEGGGVVVDARTARPACHGRGDASPTLADAFAVLGLLDPSALTGESECTGLDDARLVMRTEVADRLRLSAEAAAGSALNHAVRSIATVIREEMAAREMDGAETSLLAFGGAAGAISCDVARALGMKQVYAPPAGWAAGALGGLLAPVQHTYSVYGGRLLNAEPSPADRDWYEGVVGALEERAIRGMRGEGLSPDELWFALELEVGTGETTAMIPAARSLESGGGLAAPFLNFEDRAIAEGAAAQLDIRSFNLRVGASRPLVAMGVRDLEDAPNGATGTDPATACVGRKAAVLDGAPTTVNVFRRAGLRPGDIVAGPAIVESRGDAFVVPSGMFFTVDGFLGGTIARTTDGVAGGPLNAHAWA